MVRNKHQEDSNPGSDPRSDPGSNPGSDPGFMKLRYPPSLFHFVTQSFEILLTF